MRVFCLCLLALFVAHCSSSGKLIESPKVKVTDVKVKSSEGKQVALDIVMNVTNPNGISVTVDSLKYDLQVNDKTVTSGTFDEKVKIPAHQTTEVAIPLTVQYSDLVSTALEILLAKGAPYRALGSVKIGPFTIPFDEKGKIKLKDL